MYQNVGYELHGLENLFATGLSGVREPEGLFEPDRNADFVRQEVARIRHHFLQKVFTFEDEGCAERYVRVHQRALVSLMDEISGGDHPPSFSAYYSDLDTLLAFIQRHFSKYFDEDAKAPFRSIALVRREIAGCIPLLEQKLSEAQAAGNISEIVLYPLQKFASGKADAPVSYRSLRYIRRFKKRVVKVLERNAGSGDINRELEHLLYYLNYNSQKCFRQLTRHISEIAGLGQTGPEKMERLTFLLKEVNQAAVRPGVAYHPEGESLRSQVAGFISEELSYVANLPGSGSGKPDATAPLFAGFKLKLDLSVSQLACLARIFTEAGLIRNENTSEVIRFMALSCETKKSERISAESLRIKFYNIERGTRQGIREMLLSLVKYIDRAL